MGESWDSVEEMGASYVAMVISCTSLKTLLSPTTVTIYIQNIQVWILSISLYLDLPGSYM